MLVEVPSRFLVSVLCDSGLTQKERRVGVVSSYMPHTLQHTQVILRTEVLLHICLLCYALCGSGKGKEGKRGPFSPFSSFRSIEVGAYFARQLAR